MRNGSTQGQLWGNTQAWWGLLDKHGPVPVAMSCPGPDVAHKPMQKSAKTGGRKYFLFTACEAGCLPCVRRLVVDEGIDPRSESTTCHFSAIRFAELGYKRTGNEGCLEVAAWLRTRIATDGHYRLPLTNGTVERTLRNGNSETRSLSPIPLPDGTVEATVCPVSQQVVEKMGKNKISADHKIVAPHETRVPDTHLTLPTSSSSCAKPSERGVPKAQFVKKKEEAAKARAMRAALRDSIRARSSGADGSEGESAGVASSEALSNRGVKRRWKDDA